MDKKWVVKRLNELKVQRDGIFHEASQRSKNGRFDLTTKERETLNKIERDERELVGVAGTDLITLGRLCKIIFKLMEYK